MHISYYRDSTISVCSVSLSHFLSLSLCHPLPLNKVDVELSLDESANSVNIVATATTSGKTGVEMEALTAVSVAALTVYDMCKAVDRAVQIDGIRLLRKTGGQSGDVDLTGS